MKEEIERIKKQTELIKEVLNEFLQTMQSLPQVDYKKTIKLHEIKEALNQPEGYQGLNKWYRTAAGHIIFAVSINNFNCYGIRVKSAFNRETHWCNDFALRLDNIDRLAIESEIIEAIKKGCEQHGIVEGARVKGLSISTYTEVLDFKSIKYDHERNMLHISVVNDLPMVHACVFENGKFAEVVKDEKENDNFKTTPQLKKEIEEQKELLKECLEIINCLFERIPIQYRSENTETLTNHFLTKLNNHLNHE